MRKRRKKAHAAERESIDLPRLCLYHLSHKTNSKWNGSSKLAAVKKSTGCDDQQLCDDNDDVDGMRYDIITKSAMSLIVSLSPRLKSYIPSSQGCAVLYSDQALSFLEGVLVDSLIDTYTYLTIIKV